MWAQWGNTPNGGVDHWLFDPWYGGMRWEGSPCYKFTNCTVARPTAAQCGASGPWDA